MLFLVKELRSAMLAAEEYAASLRSGYKQTLLCFLPFFIKVKILFGFLSVRVKTDTNVSLSEKLSGKKEMFKK